MTKEVIQQTAIQRYATYGIKAVSMDEIAKSLGISKKTLYCNFRTKEELLIESLRSEMEKLQELLELYVRQSGSALEALVRFKQETWRRNLSICPAFHRDLPGFPAAYTRFQEYRGLLYRRCKTLLEQAVKEGLLIREQNYDLIARLYAEDTEHVSVQYELFLTLLRGSCTPVGRELLHSF